MKTIIKFNSVIICAIIFILSSCNKEKIYDESIAFSDATWLKDSIVQFAVNVKDTNATYDISLTITNDNDYQYANLYMFTNIIFPTKEYLRDTVEFILATNDGQWLGTGMSGYTNEFQFRSNVKFPTQGTYILSFEQALRCTNNDCSVKGIRSLSCSVQKHK